MFENTSLSEENNSALSSLPFEKAQRVKASASISFKTVNHKTRLEKLYQQGSAKIRLPKSYDTIADAVLINTAGGLTGGDRLNWSITLKKATKVMASTQACERAYRSKSGFAEIKTHIHLKEKSQLFWLPQETIFYDGSALKRTFDITMEKGSRLLVFEMGVLGRQAMGETISNMLFHDCWRLRYDNKLVFADDLRLTSNASEKALLNHKPAFASLLFITGESDDILQNKLEDLRKLCPDTLSGFSVSQRRLTGRILANTSYDLREKVKPMLEFLCGRDMPRVWRI